MIFILILLIIFIIILVINYFYINYKASKKLNDEKISIAGMVAKKLPDNKASIHLQLNVKRKEDLDYVIAKLEQLSYVFSVSRLT